MIKSKPSILKLKQAILKCDSAVLYEPIKNEIDYNNFFLFELPIESIKLPKDKNSDPFSWAKTCIREYKNNNPFILIPGKQFDIYGTRHGRGVGWYDRFLSAVPKDWLRVGIAEKTNLSLGCITHQGWDEPVDWVVVCDGSVWDVYETLARVN